LNFSKPHAALALGVIALGGLIGVGAAQIASDAGYAGVGANFLPLVVAVGLGISGMALLWGAHAPQSKAESDDGFRNVAGFWWLSAGLLLDALFIERIGFTLAGALLFTCVARGFGDRRVLRNLLIGAAIAWPMYLLFTRVFSVTLPALLGRGAWI
jgi:putative tricarboxylic transport membrane protein